MIYLPTMRIIGYRIGNTSITMIRHRVLKHINYNPVTREISIVEQDLGEDTEDVPVLPTPAPVPVPPVRATYNENPIMIGGQLTIGITFTYPDGHEDYFTAVISNGWLYVHVNDELGWVMKPDNGSLLGGWGPTSAPPMLPYTGGGSGGGGGGGGSGGGGGGGGYQQN